MAYTIPLAPLACVLIFAATLIILTEHKLDASWGIELSGKQRFPTAIDEVRKRNTLIQSCARIAESYHLSQRGEEVLILLAQRKTAKNIEMAPCVAYGTAKAHIRHVYQKLESTRARSFSRWSESIRRRPWQTPRRSWGRQPCWPEGSCTGVGRLVGHGWPAKCAHAVHLNHPHRFRQGSQNRTWAPDEDSPGAHMRRSYPVSPCHRRSLHTYAVGTTHAWPTLTGIGARQGPWLSTRPRPHGCYQSSMLLRALPLFQKYAPSSSAKCWATCSKVQGLLGSRPPVSA